MPPQLSVRRTSQIARMWARIYQYRSATLGRLSSRIRQGADLSRIDNLAREMAPVLERDPTCAAKYTDYSFWIPFNVARIGKLSLHKSPPLRILDIGCGPGYFLAAARACGHDCHGVDAPPNILTDVERRVYAELLGALGCSALVSPLLIERYVPMTVAHLDLDLITAFWICFNRHHQPDEWRVSEWRFFVEDALSHLREGGLLHLELNANPERYGSQEWYDKEILDYFLSAGTVEGGVVRIRKGNAGS
jgi:SAM-dependent methyltransferase